MIETSLINLRRFALLVPGLIAAYLATTNFYPLFDTRLPDGPATLLTYIIAAYILIPALMRVVRLFIKTQHVPVYCTTPDGFASDPINIALVGTKQQVQASMKAAGWYEADKRTAKTVFKMGLSMLTRKPYPTAPFSNLFLFGRAQDIGFQIPVGDNPAHRHHVRFWGVIDTDDPAYREHALFWKRKHQPPDDGKVMWIGAASKDIGLGVIRHNAQLTHMIHYDTNAERDLIVKQLRKAGQVSRVRNLQIGAPFTITNRVLHGYLRTDGKLKICELKN